MYVYVHERVQHWLHQLVGEGPEVVVVQLDPLQTVKVLEGWSRNFLNPEKRNKYFPHEFLLFIPKKISQQSLEKDENIAILRKYVNIVIALCSNFRN